jgi:hypothetical protein
MANTILDNEFETIFVSAKIEIISNELLNWVETKPKIVKNDQEDKFYLNMVVVISKEHVEELIKCNVHFGRTTAKIQNILLD